MIMCSGQIYWELRHALRKADIRDTVLVRLEQLAPFPHDRVARVSRRYHKADVLWVQEEPKNMGAWSFVRPRAEKAIAEWELAMGIKIPRTLSYVGRPTSATTATASPPIHRTVSAQHP